ncbi:Protein F47D12.9 a [Aphelenchoides avenae]|nr:Protein F47D12.9 a [Aphelenchus avenae]
MPYVPRQRYPYADGPTRSQQFDNRNRRFRGPQSDQRQLQRAPPSQQHRGGNNKYGKYRNRNGAQRGHANYDNSVQPAGTEDARPLAVRSAELSDLPGFSYDPSTGKYYRILPDMPGQPRGSTMQDLKRMERESNHLQRLEISANKPQEPSKQLPIVSVVNRMQLGGGPPVTSNALRFRRNIEEGRLSQVKSTPSHTFEVSAEPGQQFVGCQFLDIRQDGKTLVGCWAVKSGRQARASSRVMCLNVDVDTDEAQSVSRRYQEGDTMLGTNGKLYSNTYGLRFKPEEEESILIHEPNLVDMSVVKVDTDVTCVLYATADQYTGEFNEIRTDCCVTMDPLVELSNDEGLEVSASPMYNFKMRTSLPVWSCAFNTSKTQIGIGTETNATIIDMVKGRRFNVSSGGKNVVAQQFSSDGNLYYLGRRNANMSCLDLRQSRQHTIGEFEDSASTGYIHEMRHRPAYILTENFQGKARTSLKYSSKGNLQIRLWDVRMRRSVLDMQGHKNSYHRVPCFVDAGERFLFAVGEDATARGWSLYSGDLLCSIPCPRTVETVSDFPRVVYSDKWGGVNGNSAVVLAVDGDLRVHELLL